MRKQSVLSPRTAKAAHLTALILGVSMSTVAWGADWVRLPIRGEDQYFYDRSKLVIEGETITYWKKVVFRRPQPVKGQWAASALMRERIDCRQHTLRLVSYLYHAADGSVLDYVAEAEKEGTPIIPDTLGDAFERHLCPLIAQDRERKAREELQELTP